MEGERRSDKARLYLTRPFMAFLADRVRSGDPLRELAVLSRGDRFVPRETVRLLPDARPTLIDDIDHLPGLDLPHGHSHIPWSGIAHADTGRFDCVVAADVFTGSREPERLATELVRISARPSRIFVLSIDRHHPVWEARFMLSWLVLHAHPRTARALQRDLAASHPGDLVEKLLERSGARVVESARDRIHRFIALVK